MANFYVPFAGEKPAALKINGHRLIFLSTDKDAFDQDLPLVGADRVRCLKGGKSKASQKKILSKLAKTSKAGVVLAPSDVELRDLISNLEHELPWMQ